MKISVAMCTYNGARYLPEQLESLALQTRLPDELVICDDNSTDQTVSILSAFAASASFPIVVKVNKQNLGSTKNFEQVIALCQGDIMALCDQDDVWLPGKLERFVAEFSRAPAVGLVFTDGDVVDENLQPAGYSIWQKLGFVAKEQERLRRGQGFDALLQGATVTGATAAFGSRFKPLVLPFPTNLPIIHDAWISMLVAAVADVLPVADRLIKYRQHGSQQVGALERNRPRRPRFPAEAREALGRPNPYPEMLAIARAVHQRLMDHRQEFDSHKVLRSLEAKILHLSVRARLPLAKRSRAPRVVRELLTGRYHRYSNGLRSAVKDLFA
jgi:glycosyltransferase involved in cell wall biosynthesis